MTWARLLWTPHPWRAGFCITDDTDSATLEGVRIVYGFLDSLGLRSTKSVWPYDPVEPCGIPPLPPQVQRGVTLVDRAYFDECRRLAARGFEICLHGASAGNNVHARTASALDLAAREFGGTDTFICHSRNAENPYWGEKVASNAAARAALSLVSRSRCSGEDPGSPYYWGDLCRARLRQMRLFKTRRLNTLAVNPSMPYFEEEKPLVPGWFSATKRSFADATSALALDRLARDNGLCVLYQYLARYADPASGRVADAFRAGAERLAGASAIWFGTVSAMMDRLRAMQAVMLAHRGRELWIANLNHKEVRGIQLRLDGFEVHDGAGVEIEREVAWIPSLGAGEVRRILLDRPPAIDPAHGSGLDAHGHARRAIGWGTGFVNAGDTPWALEGAPPIPPGRARLVFPPTWAWLRPTSRASQAERTRLLAGQLGIVAREIVLKGRDPRLVKYLAQENHRLADHASW